MNTPIIHLSSLGLSPEDQEKYSIHLGQDNTLARVTGVRKNRFFVHDGTTQSLVPAAGKLYANTQGEALFPVTGDWVILKGQRIEFVLPRKNALSRGAAGSRDSQGGVAVRNQVIAANIDTVFIVCGLDRDFNLRRIERYLTLVYNCGCTPVIILSKSDLHACVDSFTDAVEAIAFGVPVHAVSMVNKSGLEGLAPYLTQGKTVVLLGSSGAGKSTLLNHLAGAEIQTTQQVGQYAGKGLHTTTTRDLFRLPGGALIIDNPGIREIAFWRTDGDESAFPEIDAWARECRFNDCTHLSEPGCRVLSARDSGELSPKRLESWYKQQKELAFLEDRQELGSSRMEKKRSKWIADEVKRMKKMGKM